MLSGHSQIKHMRLVSSSNVPFIFFGWKSKKMKRSSLTPFVSVLLASVVCQSLLLTRLQSSKVLKDKMPKWTPCLLQFALFKSWRGVLFCLRKNTFWQARFSHIYVKAPDLCVIMQYFSDLVFHICPDQLRAFLMVWRSIFLWDNQGRWLMAGFCCRLAGLINARARDLRGIIPEGHPPLPSLIIWQHPWPAQMILGFLNAL